MQLKSTTVNTLLLTLTLGCATTTASTVYAAQPAVTAVNDINVIGNDQNRYNELNTRLDNAESNCDDAVAIAQALDTYDSLAEQLNVFFQSIQLLRQTLEVAWQNNQVTSTYELDGLSALEGQISEIVGPLRDQISSLIRGCFERSFPVTGQISSAVSQLGTYLSQNGLAEEFAEEYAAVQAKATDANTQLQSYQTQVGTETDYAKKLELARAAETYINNIKTEIDNDIATIRTAAQAIIAERQAACQEAYNRLTADFTAFQTLYQTVYAEFQAIASYYQFQGQAWEQARTYGGQLGGMQSGMQGINATLQQAYAAGTLTAETTLASLYPQYADMEGSLNSMKFQFEQQIRGIVQGSIMRDLSEKLNTQMSSLIGEVENQVQAVGMTEQYTDRLSALNTKKTEATTKFSNEYMPAITAAFGSGNYAEAMNQAIAAATYVNRILSEIQTECDAIKAEIEEAYNAKVAENQTAYERLMGQIAELEAYYNTVNEAFQANIAKLGDQANSFGYQLYMINQRIQGLKGAVNNAYGKKELTAESDINSFGQYDSLKANLESIMNAINEATGISTVKAADGSVQGKVYDLSGRSVSAPGKGLYIINGKKVVLK